MGSLLMIFAVTSMSCDNEYGFEREHKITVSNESGENVEPIVVQPAPEIDSGCNCATYEPDGPIITRIDNRQNQNQNK